MTALLYTLSASLPIVITLSVIVVLFAVLFLIFITNRNAGKKEFKELVEILAAQVNTAQQELETMLLPTHLVINKDIEDFKTKYKSLLANIEGLKKHKDYKDAIFEKKGIKLFLYLLFDNIQQRKEESNRIYFVIETIKDFAAKAMNDYRTFMHPAHYFAYSELESFLESYNEIKEKVDFIFPKYAHCVTDEDSKQLSSVIMRIESERIEHNKAFVSSELEANKLYFDHILGTYPLDPQQRDSIVKLEDNCLVIASAGSGKTSTIVGKVKYLVEKQHVIPSKILLLTYTKKAALELYERMNIEGIKTGTFHSLAYRIIAETTGQAPSICEADMPLKIFHQLLQNKQFLHAIDHYIINLQSLTKYEHDYQDAFAYFEDRKKYGIQALFPDVDGNIIFTKSEEEKKLCSILTRLGIPYRYERDYPYNTRTNERRQYKPDFTIYYKDTQGQWQRIYLEHFAVDDRDQVPEWFGEGTKGGWREANQKYHKSIEWKRDTHRKYHTTLIETTSADFHHETIETKLREMLQRHGVPIRERTDEELYNMLITRNRQLEKTVFTLLLSFITLMKANESSIEKIYGKLYKTIAGNLRTYYIINEIITPFYEAYEAELANNHEIDFTDAIIQATQICREGLWQHYDYILVDEFQDISVDRYKLLQALRSDKPKTKMFCVGDDWQSIFRFAGSDMSLFYEFEKYFGFTEICRIETTYRFHQPLIDKSSGFILKNRQQRKKTVKPPVGDTKHTYLKFVKCGSETDSVLKKVEEIVASLPKDEDVLLLGRYNYDAMSVGFKGDISMRDNRIKVRIAGRDLFFLSVHSAKGLEADNVILVNCNQGPYGFPSLIEDDPILDCVLSSSEDFPFAEERRLFYVAMTRAQKNMYILYDQHCPSPFISEFMLQLEVGSYICPRCLEGKIVARKDGIATNGVPYRSFFCSNNDAGCDFFETRFGDLTPPGILVTEEMTAQDLETMRDNRRRAKRSSR